MTFIQTAMGGNYDTIKNAVKRLEGVGLLYLRRRKECKFKHPFIQ